MIGPVVIVLTFIVAGVLMAGVGAPDPRWLACAGCGHLRVEHRPDGKACEVRETVEAVRPDRCECRGFRPKPGDL